MKSHRLGNENRFAVVTDGQVHSASINPDNICFILQHISTYTVIYSLHISTYTVISTVVYWPVSRTSWVNLYQNVKPLWMLLEYWLLN